MRRRLVVRGGLFAAGVSVWGVAGCQRSEPPAPSPAPAATAAPPPTSPSPAASVKLGTIIGGTRYFSRDDLEYPKFLLCQVNLDTGENRSTDFTFLAHGFALDPTSPRRACFFEKKGPGACEFDLVDAKVLRPIASPPKRHFYGHGTFTKDGSSLLTAENDLETYLGMVVVRDGKTFQELGQFPSYGMNPHDCQLIDDGATLVITNGGGDAANTAEIAAPCVAFVDAKSQKLLEKLTFTTPRINAGHLAFSKARDVVTVSAPRDGLPKEALGGITMRVGSGAFTTLEPPEDVARKMVGETLSVTIHEPTGVVIATNPTGNVITFWDLKTMKFLKSLDMQSPRGVTRTLDDSRLVVTDVQAKLVYLSPEKLEPTAEQPAFGCGMSGSHIYTWDSSKA